MNSADLQGFVRSELEALSAGIDDFPSDLSSDPQCPGNRDTNFTTWPDDQSFPDREDSRTIMVVKGIGQLGVFPKCSNSVSNFRCSLDHAHIEVSPVVTDTVCPTRSADSQ